MHISKKIMSIEPGELVGTEDAEKAGKERTAPKTTINLEVKKAAFSFFDTAYANRGAADITHKLDDALVSVSSCIPTDQLREVLYATIILYALEKGVDREILQDILDRYFNVKDATGLDKGYVHIPPRNQNFVGRRRNLTIIQEKLEHHSMGTITQTITGTGGVGKTQLAKEYAYLYQQNYEIVYWIDAENTLNPDFLVLAKKMGINTNGCSPDDVREKVKMALCRLKKKTLLIFDNVEDYEDVKSYIPESEGFIHVIITSRLTKLPSEWFHTQVTLGILSRNESLELIYRYVRGLEKEKETSFEVWEKGLELSNYTEFKKNANELARQLGDLPLAIVQACAYIKETSWEISEYLAKFEDVRSKLRYIEKGGRPSGYALTVGTTWAISIEKSAEQDNHSLLLVNAIAFLAPDNIPEFLLEGIINTSEDFDKTGKKSGEILEDALICLRRFSLIDWEDKRVSIHRLVQEVIINALSEDQVRHIYSDVLKTLYEKFRYNFDDIRTYSICSDLYAHSMVITKYALRNFRVSGVGLLGDILYSLSDYVYFVVGDFNLAKGLMEQCIYVFKENCDTPGESFQVAVTLNLYGSILLDMKDLDGAVNALKTSLVVFHRRNKEGENTIMAFTMVNLGNAYSTLNQPDRAEEQYEEAIDVFKSEMSDFSSNPHVGRTLTNLGCLYARKGNNAKAIEKLKEALKVQSEAYKDGSNPNIGDTLVQLGKVYLAEHDTVQALRNFEKALSIYSEKLDAENAKIKDVKECIAYVKKF